MPGSDFFGLSLGSSQMETLILIALLISHLCPVLKVGLVGSEAVLTDAGSHYVALTKILCYLDSFSPRPGSLSDDQTA